MADMSTLHCSGPRPATKKLVALDQMLFKFMSCALENDIGQIVRAASSMESQLASLVNDDLFHTCLDLMPATEMARMLSQLQEQLANAITQLGATHAALASGHRTTAASQVLAHVRVT
eukprot:jgi/Mesvir1/5344/Mv15432-RA.1